MRVPVGNANAGCRSAITQEGAVHAGFPQGIGMSTTEQQMARIR